MSALTTFLVIYGVIAITHILIQMYLGHLEHRKQNHKYYNHYHQDHDMDVSVVVPVYNESPEVLELVLSALEAQVIAPKSLYEIIVVDDGSTNIKAVEKVYKKHEGKLIHVERLKKNVGKRHAQKYAFDRAKGEVIVTIDSDTILRSKHAIETILKRMKDPEVGAVTGDVRVENKKTNFLTQLINYRYWTAFHQERAAQSYFDVMMCCSGPFSAYRKSVIDEVKEDYVAQRFLGKPCTFGDDRHLTNLVLVAGHNAVFDQKAIAYTHVPETIGGYVSQQIRWNKSFYREMIWTLKSVKSHHWYLIYDLLAQLILPFMLIIALVATAAQAVANQDISYVWKYFLILFGIALLRAAYGIYRTKDFGFLRFLAYGLMHVFILIPTRMYALVTIGRVKWGTR